MAGPGKKPSPAQLELRMVQSKADIENPAIAVTARALLWKQPRLWEDFPGSLPSTAPLNDRWVFLRCGGASEAFTARAGGTYLLFLVREPLPRWTDCTWRNPQISHFKVYSDHKLQNILIKKSNGTICSTSLEVVNVSTSSVLKSA